MYTVPLTLLVKYTTGNMKANTSASSQGPTRFSVCNIEKLARDKDTKYLGFKYKPQTGGRRCIQHYSTTYYNISVSLKQQKKKKKKKIVNPN